MTLSFLNKDLENDNEKIVDVVDEKDKKIEVAEEEEKEEEFNPSENYSNQYKYYKIFEKDNQFDDIGSSEEEEDEDEEDEQDQDEEGLEEEVSEEEESHSEDVSEESRCEEEGNDNPQFGKRMFSDLYSPADQEKLEDPVVKKQKFEISEILSSAV